MAITNTHNHAKKTRFALLRARYVAFSIALERAQSKAKNKSYGTCQKA